MKKTFTLFTILLVALSARGQALLQNYLLELGEGTGWVNSYKLQNFYNAQRQQTGSENKAWNLATSSWANNSIASNTLTATGKIDVNTSRAWNTTTSAYENSTLTYYVYNPQDLNIEMYYQRWNLNHWEGYLDVIYTYNAAGKVSGYISKAMNTQTQLWVNNSMVGYSYNAAGLNDSTIVYSWVNNLWVPGSLTVYTYNGTQITETNQKVYTAGAWVNSTKSIYTYGAAPGIQNVVQQQYSNGTWSNYMTSAYSNDAAGTPLQITGLMWNATSQAYENYMRITYGYLPVGVRQRNAPLFSVHPNPAKDAVTISLVNPGQAAVITISNAAGQVVKTEATASGQLPVINTGRLNPGAYTITVTQNSETSQSRFIKQ